MGNGRWIVDQNLQQSRTLADKNHGLLHCNGVSKTCGITVIFLIPNTMNVIVGTAAVSLSFFDPLQCWALIPGFQEVFIENETTIVPGLAKGTRIDAQSLIVKTKSMDAASKPTCRYATSPLRIERTVAVDFYRNSRLPKGLCSHLCREEKRRIHRSTATMEENHNDWKVDR